MNTERRRLTLAFLFSLLIHAVLLSLTFGDQGFGLPGLSFPWQTRRIEVPDLRVMLVPAQTTSVKPADKPTNAPLQQASTAQTIASISLPKPAIPTLPERAQTAETTTPKAMVQAQPVPSTPTDSVPATAPLRNAAPAQNPEPAVIAVEQPSEPKLAVPATPAAPTAVIAVASSASVAETMTPALPDASKVVQKQAEPAVQERVVETIKPDPAAQLEAQRQEMVRQEAARIEAERLAAQRQEAARQETARIEAARLKAEQQEAARQEAQRREASRLEAARAEAARQEAAQQEAQRQEMARQEAERKEAARLEAQRQAAQQEAQRREAARQEAARAETARLEAQRQEATRQAAAQQEVQRQEIARQEAARAEAARLEAARVSAEQDAEAKREARLRAIGRQLDEEAARRKATVRPTATLPLSLSTTRRGRLWGRADPNLELVQYAEAWARKIQFNTPVDTVRDVANRPHTHPVVTVAIRSDGSVESVTFVLSSGVPEVDTAIRRIVESHVPYPAFPPALARKFDVIEVRRTWHFDTSIQLD